MKKITGTNNRILEIDVSTRSFKETRVSETDRKKYLGGKGLGLKLLFDRMAPGIDPLGSENIIAIMTGVYLGSGAPNSGRFSAVTKSPLTGIFTTSSCGGPFGMALKTSGWDGVLISGESREPVTLLIDTNGVAFRGAGELWGKNTEETQEALKGDGRGALVIGPAGENLVRYANIASGSRFLGRNGMGTVLGAKKIKAIVAKGRECTIVPRWGDKFK
ncbi:MAG: aldehyde ferredoxin oxidoreductase, partial [bacterium]|nr:aldehyde ferredoxin oxidoreductase [bacterium]